MGFPKMSEGGRQELELDTAAGGCPGGEQEWRAAQPVTV